MSTTAETKPREIRDGETLISIFEQSIPAVGHSATPKRDALAFEVAVDTRDYLADLVLATEQLRDHVEDLNASVCGTADEALKAACIQAASAVRRDAVSERFAILTNQTAREMYRLATATRWIRGDE